MENQEIKLDDRIITCKDGTEFIFPAYAIDTIEKLKAKIIEYGKKEELAIRRNDKEGMNKANKMLELLTTQKFSTNENDCQAAYLENVYIYEPARSPEERAAEESRRTC